MNYAYNSYKMNQLVFLVFLILIPHLSLMLELVLMKSFFDFDVFSSGFY